MTRFYLLLLVLQAWACSGPSLERYEDVRPKMGTEFRIVLYAPDAQTAERASEAAWRRIDELEDSLSDYEATSELSRLSAASRLGAPTPVTPVSDDLWRVLVAAEGLWLSSNGAFDVTVGPFVRLWRRAARQDQPPDARRFEQARAAVGQEHLRLLPATQSVQLLRPDMRLDLGGIAKGFALDQALLELARHGVERALVDGGGDLALGEPPPGSEGWSVRIQGSPEEELCLVARAGVATSGHSERSFEWQGLRYSHIVDPRSGLGLTHGSAVTVVAPSAMRADALASAACVLGPERGLDWIEKLPDAEAQFRPQQKAAAAPCDSSGYRRRMQLPPPR